MKREEVSENEEDEIKEKEALFQTRRLLEQREAEKHIARAEGPPLTVHTKVRPTFDNDSRLFIVRLPNVVGITPQPFDPSTYVMEEAFAEKATAASGAAATAAAASSAAPSRSASAAGATPSKGSKKKKQHRRDAEDEDEEDDEDGETDEPAAVKKEDSTSGAAAAAASGASAEPSDRQVRLSVENIIRWRHKLDPATGAIIGRESNARLVKFADGSQFLYLGGEIFQVNQAPLKSDKNYCLQTVHGVEAAKKSVGKFDSMIKFRVTGIHSASHHKLKAAISMAHVQKPKIQRRYDMIAATDMAQSAIAITQLEKDDEIKRRKRERLNERERHKRGGAAGDRERERERQKRDRTLSAGFLEGDEDDDDDDDEEAEETFQRRPSSHSKRRRVDDSDEDETQERLMKAKNYTYADDEEGDEDEDDDEPSSARKKRGGKKGGKRGTSSKDEAAKDEPEEEDVVIRRGKTKRKQLDSDEEDE